MILELNSRCNNNCVYCYIPVADRKEPEIDANDYLKSKLLENSGSVDFTGGEPTLYSGLINLVKFAKENGYDNLTLVTNGRRLAYRSYLKKLVDAGITRVVMPLDGPNKKVTEAITRSESFDQTVRAIKNIKVIGLELGLTFVVNTINQKYAKETVQKALDLGADFINIQFLLPYVEDKVPCKKIPSSIIPSYAESVRYVKQALKLTDKINLHFIPPCFIREYQHLIEENDRKVYNYRGYEYNIKEHLEKGQSKIKMCEGCNDCAGVFNWR